MGIAFYRNIALRCTLLLALLIAGCEKSVPELVEQAKSSQAKGDRGAAVIHLKNAIVRDPSNVEAYTLLGMISADLGEVQNANTALHRALELRASPELVMPVLGRVMLEMERYREVLDEIKPTSKMSSQTQAELALLRGRAHLRLGKVADARTQFFLAMRDRATDARLGLANVAAAEGDSKATAKLMEELLASAPESAEVWMFKGDIARAEGKSAEALIAYRRAAELQPANLSARLSQAVADISMDNYDAARAEIETARKLAPASPMLQFTRALLALREQKYAECRDALQQVGRQLPQHMPSVLLSGTLFLATGQLEQSQKAFYTYLSRYPGNVYARKMLAATMLRKAQPQSAIHAIEPLLTRDPPDAELLSLAGQAYLQLGQIGKARQYLEQAVEIDPKNARTRMSLGMTRLAGGDMQLAVSELESAVALKPTDVRAESYLIMALIAQKDTAKALQAAQVLESRQGKEPVTHLMKGAVYLAKQEIAPARASFEHALKLRPGYFPAAAALAQIDLREKNPVAARERMESVLKHDKSNLDAMLTLAKLEFDAGRRTASIAWLRRAQGDHPQALQPYLMLAQIQLDADEPNDALIAARQAREMNPGDPRPLEILGRAQMAAGDKSAAIVSFSALAGLLPKSASAQLQLASALAANGDQREALAAAKKALQLDPTSLDAMAAIGTAYLESKRYREALELARDAQKHYPQVGYALEGDIAMAQQEYARAAAAYRKADAAQASGLLRRRVHEADTLASKGAASDAPLLEWIQQHPQDVETRLYLGDQYAKTKNYKTAIEMYEAALKINPRIPA